MDAKSDSTSVRSAAGTPTSLKTPNSLSPGSKKQVGFVKPNRPKLIIPPPPQDSSKTPSIFSAHSGTIPGNSSDYGRKASVFMFDQIHGIKDFTKSGLGIGEKCAYWMYSKLKSWSRKWFTHMFLTIVLMLYTVGGAVIFKLIEDKESTSRIDLRLEKRAFVRDIRNMSIHANSLPNWEALAVERMKAYESSVMLNYLQERLYNTTTSDTITSKGQPIKTWTFLNSIVYCATIYTTMGYGHIYPETNTGKALTIVYAIVGIPLFLIALTDFGKLFTRCIKYLWSYIRRMYYTGSCRRVRKTTHVNEIFKGAQMMFKIATFQRPADPENPPADEEAAADDTPTTPAISNFEIDDEFNLPISIAILILVLYIFMGTLLYMPVEQWSFSDAFYFVFISMSTIGFGDLVPYNPFLMIGSIIYLVFGLALTSMCINVVQAKLSDTFKRASTKIGATMGIEVEEEGEEEEEGDAAPAANSEAPKGSEAIGNEQNGTNKGS